MRVLVFFLSLCFLLLQGNSSVYAAMQHTGNYYAPSQHVGQDPQLDLTTTSQDRIAMRAPELDRELECIVVDEVEDDEEDLTKVSAPRFRLPAQRPSSRVCQSYSSILKHHTNCFKTPPPFLGQVPDLCILQGVFRI
jgi:hypothetical protein